MSLSTKQKNKIREEFRKEYEDSPNESIVNNPREIADFFLSKFDELQAEAKEELRKKIGGMKIKNLQCDCRVDFLGEHNCDITSNEVIDEVLQILNS